MLMGLMLYLLFSMIKLFLNSSFVQLVKIPPLMPIFPYFSDIFNVSWLPSFYFTYWIIAIAIVAIVHEASHGILARSYNVKIKSTGFGILGPFLAFFVEQDDKQMKKAKIFPQLSILAAGVFANILFGIIFFFLMFGFFHATYAPGGIYFNDYSYNILPYSSISGANFTSEKLVISGLNFTKIVINNQGYWLADNFLDEDLEETTEIILYYDMPAVKTGLRGAISSINNFSTRNDEEYSAVIENFKPGEKVIVKTIAEKKTGEIESREYEIVLATSPINNTKPVIGVVRIPYEKTGFRGLMARIATSFKDPMTFYFPKFNPEVTKFFYDLLWWIVLINLSLALTNMLPVGIFDGGRFFMLTLLAITGNKKIAEKSFKLATKFILLLFALLMVLWLIGSAKGWLGI